MKNSKQVRGSFIRMCAGCSERADKRTLTRICALDGRVFIDEGGKSDGRGAYFCGKKECLDRMIKSKRLTKLLRCPVPSELYIELEDKIDR